MTDPASTYARLLDELRLEFRLAERASLRLAAVRLATALATALLAAASALSHWALAPLELAVVGAGLFVIEVGRHERLKDRIRRLQRLIRVNERGVGRASGGWRAFPEKGDAFRDENHPFSDDLDLFGQGSLFQMICCAHTAGGERSLARMLDTPADLPVVSERQRAVEELAGALEWRQAFEAEALSIGAGAKDPEPLAAWLESGGLGRAGGPWALLLMLLPPATLAGFGVWLVRGGPMALWTLPLSAQIVAVAFLSRSFARAYGAVAPFAGAVGAYRRMLERLLAPSFSSAALGRLQEACRDGGAEAPRALGRLERIVQFLDVRHGALHPLLNALFLFDLFAFRSLERWRKRHGRRLRGWIGAVSEAEALASLAALRFDNPGYAFPEVLPSEAVFEAEALGHPLLPADRRVVNDVNLPGRGAALLVTGSNMSGKSTLLRAVGINAALAYAGGPVCARSLRISRLELRTSIRSRDSLEEGVSGFYAELRKLSRVVRDARGDRTVLFLLDEILNGTNPQERRIGAEALVRYLVQSGGVGVVTTHDLALVSLEERFPSRIRNAHFTDIVDGDSMTFDYRLREGPVEAGNALRLMRRLGLPVN